MTTPTDPFAGYINHPLDTVAKALPVIMKGYTVETVADGTNPTPGMKPKRIRVFYNKSTRLVSRVAIG